MDTQPVATNAYWRVAMSYGIQTSWMRMPTSQPERALWPISHIGSRPITDSPSEKACSSIDGLAVARGPASGRDDGVGPFDVQDRFVADHRGDLVAVVFEDRPAWQDFVGGRVGGADGAGQVGEAYVPRLFVLLGQLGLRHVV